MVLFARRMGHREVIQFPETKTDMPSNEGMSIQAGRMAGIRPGVRSGRA